LNASGNLNCIAVDPENGDHAIAVFSNYNAHSIHFTEDGGSTWYRAGGNLEAENAPEGFPDDLYNVSTAPSIRWARIMNVSGGKVYFVGTSVGLFATRSLAYGTDRQSDSTKWVQIAKEEIGNTVVMMLDSRDEDQLLAAATHGSGMYTGIIPNNWNITSVNKTSIEATQFKIYPNPASDFVSIESNAFTNGVISLQMLDAKGNSVYSKRVDFIKNKPIGINTTHLSSGIYIIRATQKESEFSQKIMIK
jgi:hypothetical protein